MSLKSWQGGTTAHHDHAFVVAQEIKNLMASNLDLAYSKAEDHCGSCKRSMNCNGCPMKDTYNKVWDAKFEGGAL